MATVLAAEVLQDDIAVSLARVLASANKHAREMGVDIQETIITITQHILNRDVRWRINYGPRDYVGRRGGDLIIEVDPKDARVTQVLRGQ
jgi:hypothetical protein